MSGDAPTFTAFFERHFAELSRLAYLLTGDAAAADDLAADALSQVRRDWPRVAGADPVAYARGLIATRTRRGRPGPVRRDPAVSSLREALGRLPHRRRACVVLRYAFGLSEPETARALGISAGTVHSRTTRGVRQLSALLGSATTVSRVGGWEAAR